MAKEVLKIVNPNVDKEYQAAQNSHNSFIINPPTIKKADKTKTNENGPRQRVLNGAIVLAAIVIVSVIATGAPLLQYLPAVNDQKLTNIIRPNPISISHSVEKYQPVSNSIPTSPPRQGSLYFITITTTNGSNGQPFIDSVFIVEDTINDNHNYHHHNDNVVHKIMIDAGTDKRL